MCGTIHDSQTYAAGGRFNPFVTEGRMSSIVDITERQYKKEVLDSKTPIIVDLWAPWCQPCKGIERELDAVIKSHGSRVRVVKVNIDENPTLVSQLEIKSVPTILFYRGKNYAPISIVGATTARAIVSRFRLDELPVQV